MDCSDDGRRWGCNVRLRIHALLLRIRALRSILNRIGRLGALRRILGIGLVRCLRLRSDHTLFHAFVKKTEMCFLVVIE